MTPMPDAERRRERYLRHERAAGLEVDVLQATRLVVVGAGAVGNEVVKNAALLGVGRIDVHDFDTIERHNLTRSVFFRDADVGRPKATTLAERAGEVDPHVQVRAIEGDAWRTLTLQSLQGAGALIAAVDQFEARMRLSQLAALAGVHFVSLGIDSRHASVESFPYAQASQAGADCACFECHLPASAYRQVAARYSCGWLRRALWRDRTVPTTAITASVAGALGVQAALRLGVAIDDPPVAVRQLIDTRSGQSTRSALARQPDCPACGRWTRTPPRHPAGRTWRDGLTRAMHADAEAALLLSEALVFGAECVACGPDAATSSMIGRRASDFDESAERCSRCGDRSVRLDLRTECTAADLIDLSQRAGGARPPLKFAIVLDAAAPCCIDFEDDGAAVPSSVSRSP